MVPLEANPHTPQTDYKVTGYKVKSLIKQLFQALAE